MSPRLRDAAVVADWLAAQPPRGSAVAASLRLSAEFQRHHDVRLLRGGDDA